MKRIWTLLCSVAVVALVLAGCGGGGDKKEGGSGGRESGLSGEIRLVALLDLSGPISIAGKESEQGMRLAIEQVNESGLLGDARLVVDFHDTKSDKDQAVTLARRAIRQDRVTAIVGLTAGQVPLVVGALAGQEKVPAVGDTVIDPAFARLNDYTFLSIQPFIETIEPFVQGYAREQGWRRVAIFRNVEVPTEEAQTKEFVEQFESIGAQVKVQTFDNSTSDYNAQLTELKSFAPDVIVLQDVPNSNAAVMRQARTLGFESDFTGTAALLSPGTVGIAGAIADGTVFPSPWIPDLDNPENRAFVESFKTRYNADPGIWAMEGFTAITLVANAIKTAGSADPQAVRDALASTSDLPTPEGRLSYTEDGIPSVPGVIVEIANGRFKPLGPLNEDAS